MQSFRKERENYQLKAKTQWRACLISAVVRAACWPPLPPAMCGSTISATRPVPVPVVDDAYPYSYPTRAEEFYSRLHWDGPLPQTHI